MSKNWDYSDLSHAASEAGGPQKFVDQVADINFQRGVQAEKSTEGWKGILLVSAAIGLGLCVGNGILLCLARPSPLGLDFKKRLRETIEVLILQGYKHMISGGAQGMDIMAAETVVVEL